MVSRDLVFDEKYMLKKYQEQMKLLMKILNYKNKLLRWNLRKKKLVKFKTKVSKCKVIHPNPIQ